MDSLRARLKERQADYQTDRQKDSLKRMGESVGRKQSSPIGETYY